MSSQVQARNPYIAGKAIGSDRGFFGRDDILRVVQDSLSSGHQSAIVLAGQRRIGKTSILLQLQRCLPADRFCPVYFDLMDRAEEPLSAVLNDLSSAMADSSATTVHAIHSDDDGAVFREQFLPQLYSALGQGRRPVLLLDEFDVLDSAAQRRMDPHSSALKLFPYLRRLMEQDDRLAFVFVVGRKPDELSIQFKVAFKSALFKKVSVLAMDDARRLVLTAERDGTLRFELGAVERILSFTAGHPLFTQLMCQILWDWARGDSPDPAPTVSAATVDGIVERTLEAGENVFQWIWDGLPPAERIISSAVARATEAAKTVSEEELLQTLQGHGIRILTRELNLAPDTLVEWEVFRRVDDGFEFFTELMRLWVQSRKPLPKVKSELDRIVQPADELFRSAEAIYRQGDHTGVEELLQQVLRINPNHVNARLLLGALFLEQDRAADAIAILEQAYQFDQDNARYPLIRALIAQGSTQEAAGKEDLALGTYDRILELSPRERNASERRIAILLSRGNRKFEAGEFTEAEAAFAAAGANDRLEQVATAQRLKRIDELSKQVVSDDLPSKIRVLEKLLSLEPDNEKWKIEWVSVEKQLALERNYADGVSALAARDFEKSISSLAEVVHLEPNFRDAATMLAKAARKLKRNKARKSRWRKAAILLGGILLAVIVLLIALGILGERRFTSPRDYGWESDARVTMSEQPEMQPMTAALEFDAGQKRAVFALFVPRSQLLLTGGEDGVVRLWHADSRKQLFERDHKSALRAMAISRNGDRFITLAGDNTVRIFAIRTGSSPTAYEVQHVALNGPVTATTLSPDGTKVAVLTSLQNYKSELIIFAADTGEALARTSVYNFASLDELNRPLDGFSLGFSPTGNVLSFVGLSTTFTAVPQLASLDFLRGIDSSGLQWARDEQIVALRGYWSKNRIAIWRIAKSTPDDLIDLKRGVGAFAFSPNLRFYVVGTDDGMFVFDRDTEQQVLRGPQVGVKSLEFSDDGSRFVAGCADGIVRVFVLKTDTTDGRPR
jgi:WD40 repeat protein/tetratricopeptide (TPR) repeat protein